jgi:hypothetical protein
MGCSFQDVTPTDKEPPGQASPLLPSYSILVGRDSPHGTPTLPGAALRHDDKQQGAQKNNAVRTKMTTPTCGHAKGLLLLLVCWKYCSSGPKSLALQITSASFGQKNRI